MKSIWLFLFCGLIVTNVHAGTPEPSADDKRWAGNSSMNGYKFESYSDFQDKWQLVTVRYRQDTGEFRFVYANPSAWKTLKAGRADYPDGAVFGKIGYRLKMDPRFPASLVPEQVQRYQLMVRDQKVHAETGGWGYSLFDANGKTFPGEPRTVAKACAACHQLVNDLGAVFSKPIVRGTQNAFSGAESVAKLRKDFKEVAIEKLPSLLRDQLPAKTKKVKSLENDLRSNLFQGTLDEIRPLLALEARASRLPAILLSGDGKRFSAVFEDVGAKCPGEGKAVAMISVTTVTTKGILDHTPSYNSGDLSKATDEDVPAQQSMCFVVD